MHSWSDDLRARLAALRLAPEREAEITEGRRLCGLPSARWQSAMIGGYAVAPFIRLAARSSASASA